MLSQLALELGSDAAIATRLKEDGSGCSQSLIWRIRTGKCSSARYETGKAIERLYLAVCGPQHQGQQPIPPLQALGSEYFTKGVKMSLMTIQAALTRIEITSSPLAVFGAAKPGYVNVVPLGTVETDRQINAHPELLIGVFDKAGLADARQELRDYQGHKP